MSAGEPGPASASAARRNLAGFPEVEVIEGAFETLDRPTTCPFFAALQEVYDEIGEGIPEGAALPRSCELPDEREEVERSGLFDAIVVFHFDWEIA